MINAQYKLIAPREIETCFSNIQPDNKQVLVRPTMLSICKADIRYFFGMRDAKELKKKLPLALVHEAIGCILHDPSGHLTRGDKVVLLPNIPGKETAIAENYRRDSKFRSSRADGFMQEVMKLPVSQIVPYNDIPDEIASFTEFISVGVQAIKTYLSNKQNMPEKVGIWGDGGLGYIVASLLKYYIPNTHISVIGVQKSKLELFQFVDEVYTIDEVYAKDLCFDDVFECVGGQPSESAISQMIDLVMPEGILTLLGVSESPVAINTRLVLEKGLTLIGRSRSSRADFVEAIRILESSKRVTRQMKKLISEIIDVKNINDINYAFNRAKSVDFKVIMKWKI
jgi:Threonine dehydrogenase and related Zn-dependent dehydrogenases